jgi:hypothetical protein
VEISCPTPYARRGRHSSRNFRPSACGGKLKTIRNRNATRSGASSAAQDLSIAFDRAANGPNPLRPSRRRKSLTSGLGARDSLDLPRADCY